jgi:hypothetical protein
MVIAQQWLYMLHCSLLRAYPHFFSEGCAYDVCDCSRLPSPWLGSHGDYYPTAPTAPSLRPLVRSGSLIRHELVQVYDHQPWSRVPLHPVCVYHIVFPGDYIVQALPWALELQWFAFVQVGDRGTFCHPRGSPRSLPVCRNEFSSGHWPASGVGRHNCECRVDGSLNLSRDQLWVFPCRGCPKE